MTVAAAFLKLRLQSHPDGKIRASFGFLGLTFIFSKKILFILILKATVVDFAQDL